MNALLATRTGALEAARLRLFALGVPAARSFGNAAFSTFDNQPLGGMKGFSEKERAVEVCAKHLCLYFSYTFRFALDPVLVNKCL